MIVDHDYPSYRTRWASSGSNRFNGAFFYSKEIVKNIIPRVKTDRNWVTVNVKNPHFGNHSIIFIHNNLHPEHYDWLNKCDDVVMVCGIESTRDKMGERFPQHHSIYLPLSVDVENVKSYARPKTKKVAFVGRKAKASYGKLPAELDMIYGLPRTKLLPKMAEYEKIYAVGRCAIEALVLGCEILPYDDRFPDPSIWKVVDNKEAAKILQKELDKIINLTKREKNGRD